MAYQVLLEPGIGQFRAFGSPRVRTCIISSGLFLVQKLTCGKRESVSWQHSVKNRRAVGLLNPMRDTTWRQETGGRRDDACDHGLSRTWEVKYWEKGLAKKGATPHRIIRMGPSSRRFWVPPADEPPRRACSRPYAFFRAVLVLWLGIRNGMVSYAASK